MKRIIALSVAVSMIFGLVGVALPVRAITIADGDLVKTASSSAVYYIQGSNKRVFPHYNVYLSWGNPADFSGVKTVSSSELAAYSDANAVPFRDGSLFRGTTSSLGGKDATAVFYVEDAVLRPVLSETVYQGLFSDLSWSKVTWVPDDLLSKFNYDMGSDLTSTSTHPNGCLFTYSGSNQKYLIQDGKKRTVSDSAFSSNGYIANSILTFDSSETYADGNAVTGAESGLMTPGWLGTVEAGSLVASVISIPGDTVPDGASNLSVLSVRFTAGSTAASVTGLTFKRLGIGETSDWSGMYVYEGDTLITNTSRTISSDSHEVEFPTISVSIPANSSKTITLRGDLNSSLTAGKSHYFQLKAVESTATISGLPVNGNTFVIGAVTVSTITVAAGAVPSNPTLGASEASIATVKLTAGTNDAEFNQLVLSFSGSISRSDVTNLKLYQESTLLASASSIASDDTATFTMSSPYSIQDGQTRTFTVKADLGGKTAETLTTKVESANHVYAVDTHYGYGAIISGVSSALTLATMTLQGSSITFTDNGPSADEVAKNQSDVVLTKFALTADRAVEVRRLSVTLTPSADITAGSTTISDLRVKDEDTGATLMSSALSGTIASGAGTATTLTDVFNLSANVTRNLIVTVDLGTSATLDDKTLKADVANVTYATTQVYIRDVGTGDYIEAADVVGAPVSGDNQTILASSLTAAVASTPATGLTAVVGSTNIEGVGVVLTAGDGSAMRITQLQTHVYISTVDETFAYADESTDINGIVTAVKLYDGATLLSEKSLSDTSVLGGHDYGLATFDNLDINIAAGGIKKLVVKFDVLQGSSACWVAIDTLSANIITYDKDDNDVDATGAVNAVSGAAEPNRYVIIAASGGLTMAQDAATPDSAIVIAGNSGVEVSKLKFTATNEDWTIDEFQVDLNTPANEDVISAVYVTYPGGSASGQFTSGAAKFTNLDWLVEKDTEEVVSITVDFTALNPNLNQTGKEVKVGIGTSNFKATGASGTTDTDVGTAWGNEMYIRRSKPTVALASDNDTVLNNGTETLHKFTVTATGGDITLKKFTWDVVVSDYSTTGLLATSWKLYKGTTAISTAFSNGITTSSASTTGGDIPLTNGNNHVLVAEPATEITIAAGATETFSLKATVTGAVVNDSISTTLINDNNDLTIFTRGYITDSVLELVQLHDGTSAASVDFLWSDRARGVNHTATYDTTAQKDWTDGFLIDILPTNTVSLTFPS